MNIAAKKRQIAKAVKDVGPLTRQKILGVVRREKPDLIQIFPDGTRFDLNKLPESGVEEIYRLVTENKF